jgi:hypothetical protein
MGLVMRGQESDQKSESALTLSAWARYKAIIEI